MSHKDTPHNRGLKAEEALKTASKWQVKEDPYLSTRVLTLAKERSRSRLKKRAWASTIGVLSAAVLVFTFVSKQGSKEVAFQARVGEATAVKLPLQKWQDRDARYLKVQLNDKVTFYSENHPLLEKRRSLLLNFERISQNYKVLPIVVQAHKAGASDISIELLDENKNSVLNKKLKISFLKEQGKG